MTAFLYQRSLIMSCARLHPDAQPAKGPAVPQWRRERQRRRGALFPGGGPVRGAERARARHRDDVVAAVDVMDLAGDAAREIGEEVERRAADLLDRDRALQRRVRLL